jgi:hypothetical protein
MRHISVGLVIHVEDDVAAEHEALIAYLESHIFGDGLVGHIAVTEDITDRVEARLEEMRRRRSP